LSLTTKTNLPVNDAAGIEFTASGQAGSRLGYTLSGNAFRSQIDGSALGFSGLRSTTGLNAKLKLDFHPLPTDTLQLSATRTDKRLTPQGSVDAINIVNLGLRHQLEPHLVAVATLSDLFDGQRYLRTAHTPAFDQVYRRDVQGRVLYVGLVHTFGSSRKSKPTGFDYEQ